MKKIVVASKNPVKINATLAGFRAMFLDETFEASGVSVPSDVSDQPMSDAETRAGAGNRVENARRENPGADFYVGIEGGVEPKERDMAAFAWVVISSKDGASGQGRTGTFFLPPRIAELISRGMELGQADDVVFGRTNSKQEEGAVGLLTGGVMNRTGYYVEAVTLALIPFKNPTLYEATVAVPAVMNAPRS